MAKSKTKVRAGVQRAPSLKSATGRKKGVTSILKGAVKGARRQRQGKPLADT